MRTWKTYGEKRTEETRDSQKSLTRVQFERRWIWLMWLPRKIITCFSRNKYVTAYPPPKAKRSLFLKHESWTTALKRIFLLCGREKTRPRNAFCLYTFVYPVCNEEVRGRRLPTRFRICKPECIFALQLQY